MSQTVGFGVVRLRGRVTLLTTVAALAGALSACTPGAYSLDIFREMHYQPSQRLQEPNRLAPPAQAVPITGRAPAIEWADASSLQNPYPTTAQSREQAQRLFQVNCAVCHGKNADGDSAVAQRFKSAGAVPPPDFRSQRVRGRADGELYWLISEGVGNMPPFGELLTDEQRWSLIQVIRNPGQ